LSTQRSGDISEIEKRLEAEHVALLVNSFAMSEDEARSTCMKLLAKVKEQARRARTLGLPPDEGDRLLARASTDQGLREGPALYRREGVRDDDIRWWWSLHDLERRMMVAIDDLFRGEMYLSLWEQLGDHEAAAAQVRKWHPMFGDPRDTSNTDGDDRPLHLELKDRVNTYTQRQFQIDPERFRRRISGFSTFNALVRHEVRVGNL